MRRWLVLLAVLTGCAEATTEPDMGPVDGGADAGTPPTDTSCPATYFIQTTCAIQGPEQNSKIYLMLDGRVCVIPYGKAYTDYVVGCTDQSGPLKTITVPACEVCSQ